MRGSPFCGGRRLNSIESLIIKHIRNALILNINVLHNNDSMQA